MNKDDIRVRQQERFNVLRKIYDLSNAKLSRSVFWKKVATTLDYDEEKVLDIVKQLQEDELVKPFTANMVYLTSKGIKKVEDRLSDP